MLASRTATWRVTTSIPHRACALGSKRHRLGAKTGEARANKNADYRMAASCGDRSSDDGSALVPAPLNSARRSAIHSPTVAAAAARRKHVGGNAVSGDMQLAVPQPVSALYVDVA